ncbi:DUF2848 domain-containing protein [Oryzicola mucosus]|uniref:DUF2848 domain-containing protein n=1 Tax=Oryzicola mucosus TaxID=2767425 RepID=A0A8J6PMW1_9HYPH|nr:DUF2848 domain-containing protein [Oryzicola mucosus]MBD0417243.1 DUF2848 domain-containing protein [Oryzicola mucosus]
MVASHVLRLQLGSATDVPVHAAIIAGWTGRDKAALEKHIVELEELGVKRPASTPIFYRVAASRLTTAPVLESSGSESSGEVEFVLLKHGGRLWVGVGSDHTDRKVETYNITVSKQMCDKPVAPVFWDFDTVSDHWDQLILRSYIVENGARVLYQEGSVAAMLSPDELLARWEASLEDGTVMFCGTLAARGGVRPSERFEYELEDPVTGHRIAHAYDVKSLTIAG